MTFGRASCRRLAGIFIPAAFLFAGFSATASAAESCTAPGGNSNICVSITDRPDPVATNTANGNQTYLSYTTVVRNAGGNSVNHVALTQTLPTEIVSVTPASGSCSPPGGSAVSCNIGTLAKGASTSVKITALAPQQTGEVTSVATVSFAERGNDKPSNDPKTDTVAAAETTTVSDAAGQTWVEPGKDAVVNSDPAQPYRGTAEVPGGATANRPEGFLASLKPISTGGPAFICILGHVSINGSVEVCRNSDWLLADIPGTFDPPLRFTLKWDASQVSTLQNEDNFVVFYAADAGAQKQVYRRCGAAPERPCLTSIAEDSQGNWTAVLESDHNGYMK